MEWTRTLELIPDGVQTLSKMPSKHVEGVYPKYIDYGKGCKIYSGENEYIDYPLGLGAILLGHADDRVNLAVKEQLDRGVLFPLPNQIESELAEKIVSMIPCAEKVRFLKTGSEATSAAVKIARAYTKKEKVLCCGYHGWHDWYCSTTPKTDGVVVKPDTVKQLKYNDLKSFERYMYDKDVACVILEPYVLDKPKGGFLYSLQRLCKNNGALLIFDEVITGFRTLKYSAQKFFGITPDLATFGKAMANGLPISCVCGKAEVMDVIRGDCFVSSTFGGELASMAAALRTLEIVENENVPQHIWNMGDKLKNSFNSIARSNGLNVACVGFPSRTFFHFPTEIHKSLFWQECLKGGVFFGYAQFTSYAHTNTELDHTIDVMRTALRKLRKYWKNPQDVLEGSPAQQTFRLVAENGTKGTLS